MHRNQTILFIYCFGYQQVIEDTRKIEEKEERKENKYLCICDVLALLFFFLNNSFSITSDKKKFERRYDSPTRIQNRGFSSSLDHT